MQLYFIRHGQSENNALWDLTGGNFERSSDPKLTDAGRQQAVLLASFLAQSGPGKQIEQWDPQNASGFGLTHLYTSLMVRAVDTASVVAHALNLPLYAFPDIHESGGIYLDDPETGRPTGLPGNKRSFFETNYPELILSDDIGEEGWWARKFETRLERRERAQRVLTELWRKHGNTQDRIAIFSHGGFFNHFIAEIFDIPWQDGHRSPDASNGMPGGRWLLMNNAAITRLDFDQEEIRLVYQNRTDYLPRELIT
jgi:2,3-bisphosphoglycerate-dependent phosphoglycerate mutase